MIMIGADSRNRTCDLFITSELLYQLSHVGLIKASFKLASNLIYEYDKNRELRTLFFRLICRMRDDIVRLASLHSVVWLAL
jgi:hypothetical protein